MSRRVCSNWSGRAMAGSYSTNACSCVRLTATLSTPDIRPSAFSMVPVQSEQWRPPIRARIFMRSGLADGSSLHGRKLDEVVVAMLIAFIPLRPNTTSSSRSIWLLLSDHAKAGFLDRGDETILSDGLWVKKDTRLTFIERHGSHPHARLFFDQ